MKKSTTLITLLLLCVVSIFAQAPEKFSYQAVVRNASNALVANTQVGVRVNILQGSATGNAVYSESHMATTNANGLITVNIGGGSVLHGTFADIDWSDGPYFLKTDLDPNGGNDYTITSVQQLLSVPYALYAKDAGNGFSGDYNDLVNVPQIPQIPADISAFNNDAGYITGYTETDPQYNAWDKDYNDLINKPTIPTVPTNVSEFTNDAGYITTQDIPTIPTVPTNVSAFTNDAGYLTTYTETDPQYNAWNKDYNDLINKPVIPVVPTNVSGFNNDAGYITAAQVPAQVNADWNAINGAAQILNKPTIPTVPTNVSSFNNDAGYITAAQVPAQMNADWNAITGVAQILNKPTIPTVPTNVSAFNNDAGYITAAQVPAQMNADWNATTGAAQILNKPNLFSGNYNDLTNKPALFDGNYNSLSNKPNLASVAISGSYNDLTNKPSIPTAVGELANNVGYITLAQVPAQVNADWNASSGAAQILNKPTLFSGNYNDLTNKPNLFDGNYNSLNNKPDLATVATTGNYNDLNNKPIIPTNVSAFNNDAGYITSADVQQAAGVPTQVSAFQNDAGYITLDQVPAQVNADWNATSGKAQILNKPNLFSGNYNDLTNKPTLFDGNYNSLSNKPNLAIVATTGNYNDLSNKPTLFDGNYNSLSNRPVLATVATTGNYNDLSNTPTLFSGNYNDLSNKPTIPAAANNATLTIQRNGSSVGTFSADASTNKTINITVPTTTSELTNNSGFVTEAQLNALLAAMNNTMDSLRNRIEELENNPPAPQEGLPTVITLQATNVTGTSAQCGGNIPSDGGSAITARGICWSVSSNPTIDGDHTTNGTGAGTFYANLYDLQSGTTYHVRAYATNSIGTEYGNEVTFTTATPTVDGEPCPGMPTVTDVDGNIYNTVAIGQQCWMKENLKTTQFSDGTSIPWSSSNSTVPARYNPGGNASNVSTYGYLYNWYAVMNGNASSNSNPSPVQGVCPSGWHVPSNMEWSQMTGYVSAFTDFQCDNNAQNIAKALASTTNWSAIGSILCAVGYNTNLNNATGFSALPGGTRTGSVGTDGYFWTCTQSDVSTAYAIHLAYNSPSLTVGADNAKTAGYSVRCVSDIAIAGGVTQVVVTGGVTSITENSAVCGGSVIMDNGSTITARGVCWSTSPHPTVDGNHTVETAGLGGFTSHLTGLDYGTTYYVRAYAVIGGETYYGSEVFFTTLTPFICGTGTVTDYDGNVYNTVLIGDQCWMKENMRATHYANGTALGTAIRGTSSTYSYYNSGNTTSYGLLYNWYGAKGPAAVSANNQGICPTGWHVPSDGEWTELTQYVSNQSQYLCSNNTSYIAKALASTNGWNSSTGTCVVGLTPSNNNATGFSALPAGSYLEEYYSSNTGYWYPGFQGSGDKAHFWSSTSGSGSVAKAWGRSIQVYDPDVYRSEFSVYGNNVNYFYFYSVRCLRD